MIFKIIIMDVIIFLFFLIGLVLSGTDRPVLYGTAFMVGLSIPIVILATFLR